MARCAAAEGRGRWKRERGKRGFTAARAAAAVGAGGRRISATRTSEKRLWLGTFDTAEEGGDGVRHGGPAAEGREGSDHFPTAKAVGRRRRSALLRRRCSATGDDREGGLRLHLRRGNGSPGAGCGRVAGI
ncbi:hypothetical protein C4D60_Mb06t00900 [Musa balbisiana]|uniref:AP2/ERF domain-containing protein n=1 Tax=Musa balbisiana TaxID=52838 RepID=A0A4S8IKF0_MUSBA|nr:hypothetical protein C4D60_Mb06t00900 [Musa balbisiana]